jgi:hypothetical protein
MIVGLNGECVVGYTVAKAARPLVGDTGKLLVTLVDQKITTLESF